MSPRTPLLEMWPLKHQRSEGGHGEGTEGTASPVSGFAMESRAP